MSQTRFILILLVVLLIGSLPMNVLAELDQDAYLKH